MDNGRLLSGSVIFRSVQMKKLNKELIGLGVSGALAGVSIGVIDQSQMPEPIKTGTTSLIGVGFINKASKLLK